MATEQGGQQPRGPMDPLVGVANDGVRLGYQAVELVVEGLRESLRLQSGRTGGQAGAPAASGPTVPLRSAAQPPSGSGGPSQAGGSGGSSQAGGSTSTGLVGDVAAIVAELLTRAGSVANQVAQTLSEQGSKAAGGAAAVPELQIPGVAGETTMLEFSIWNTGATALRNITLSATDLVGSGARTPQDAISFKPAVIAQVGPGKAATAEVAIAIPAELPAGTYRGLIQADPGDTCAVIELTVSAPPADGAKAA